MNANDAIQKTTEDILRGLQSVGEVLAGKTLLLTGSGGFLGRWIIRTIAALNRRQPPCRVIAIDARFGAGSEIETELPDASFIHSSLDVSLGIRERIDFAMHAAGIASPFWYKQHPLETISGAVDGSRHVLNQIKGTKARYLFFSTSEVYQTPPPDQIPTAESYVGAIPTMSDRSSYDVSKALGETLAYIHHEKYNTDTGVIRIFNAFGPWINEKDHRILPRIASAKKSGRPVKIYAPADGNLPTRTYCPVANTIAGCLRALILGRPGEAYNIGASSPEINVQKLCEMIGAEYEYVEAPEVYEKEPMRRCPNIDKAKRDLDFDPIVSLSEGIETFMAWAMETYTGS